MTTISSHILDSTNGKDASGIHVTCNRLFRSEIPQEVFDGHANGEGRISFGVNTNADSDDVRYELLFLTGAYFFNRKLTLLDKSVVSEVVVRLNLSKIEDRCHVPVLIAPHNSTVWWSG